MSDERRSLAAIRLLGGVEAPRLSDIEARCTWRRYGAGERVFERGTEGHEVFFVVEGAVDVISPTPSGADFNFARIGAGEILGHMSAIDGLPRAASAVAAEDSLLAALPCERFIELLKGNGEVAVRLLRSLSLIVRETNDRVVSASSREGMERVYAVLIDLAAPDQSSPGLGVIEPFPPLRDIALRAGVTRELVASALNRLYPEGVIRRRGTTLYITDADRLRHAAAGTP
ncbi:MAG: Crp/Fnr family transcriptional regulator [Alphaproteobacteria bacterium]